MLVGDLNSAPGSAEIQALTEHLVDAWPHAGVGTGCTYSAQTPFMRIDYVLASPDIAIEQVRVVTTDASDHLPVAADLRLPAPAAARRPGHHHGEDPETDLTLRARDPATPATSTSRPTRWHRSWSWHWPWPWPYPPA